MAGFRFSKRSLAALEGVHPDLVRVATRAIAIGTVDFMVIEGLRSTARQKALYAQGRAAPGKIVTWTMKSRHLAQPDGFAHAIDCLPAPYDWRARRPFEQMAEAMLGAAKALGVNLRWGGDWDGDGKSERGESDLPHFELG